MIQRLVDAASRRRWPLTVVAFILILIPIVVVGPATESARITTLVLALAGLAFLFLLAVNLSGRDPDAEARALVVAPDPLSAALFARWMRRSRHFRFVGGLAGGIMGLAFADGSLMPVLIGILAGIAVGGAAAEIHSVGRRESAPQSADMSVRHLRDYVTRTDSVALAAVAGAAVVMIAGAVLGLVGGNGIVWASATALLAVGGAASMQWAVSVRRRPALSPDLRRADDLMRRLAATQGFTRPAIAFALMMLSQGLATLGNSIAVTVAVLILWTLALAWYVASRQSRANLRGLVGS